MIALKPDKNAKFLGLLVFIEMVGFKP